MDTCPMCRGARVEVVLGSVIPCGNCGGLGYVHVIRVDGRVECPTCGLTYREHPEDLVNVSGIDGTPYLRIGCDGQRLKL